MTRLRAHPFYRSSLLDDLVDVQAQLCLRLPCPLGEQTSSLSLPTPLLRLRRKALRSRVSKLQKWASSAGKTILPRVVERLRAENGAAGPWSLLAASFCSLCAVFLRSARPGLTNGEQKDPNWAVNLTEAIETAKSTIMDDQHVLVFPSHAVFKPDAVLSLANSVAIYDFVSPYSLRCVLNSS